jgi:hypothetical protein
MENGLLRNFWRRVMEDTSKTPQGVPGLVSDYCAEDARAENKLADERAAVENLKLLNTILAIIKMAAAEGERSKTLVATVYFGSQPGEVARLLRARGFTVRYGMPGAPDTPGTPSGFYTITW